MMADSSPRRAEDTRMVLVRRFVDAEGAIHGPILLKLCGNRLLEYKPFDTETAGTVYWPGQIALLPDGTVKFDDRPVL